MGKLFHHGPSSAAETAQFISQYLDAAPRVGIITGTGLGDITSGFQTDRAIDYQTIPNFPKSTVVSHHGLMLLGSLARQPTIIMQGRFHLYEGYSPMAVTFPIRVFQALKIEVLILINAAGGLNPEFTAGDIMVIQDHINLTGENPLIGENHNAWGPRFPDMTTAYSKRLRGLVYKAAERVQTRVRQGVYAGLKGPSLETPAEVRFLKDCGADAVGFSTVLETIAAVHAGIKVMGFATITNTCGGQDPDPADVNQIISIAKGAAPQISGIITHAIGQLREDEFV